MPVKPERAGGFNDYGPRAMSARHVLERRIREVYETFGFVPVETPMIEFMEVLAGEEGSDMRIFEANSGASGERRDLGMRFDHTVPLARYVSAQLKDLELPWRRYTFGPVFRGETTGAGRYHQFYQFDADIVGVKSLMADAEVIWLMTEAMKGLTTHAFKVRWSSRKIINGLAETLGLTQDGRRLGLFRSIDKLDKIGWKGVRAELVRAPRNEFDEDAVALNNDQAQVVENFLQLTNEGTDSLSALTQLEDLIGQSEEGQSGIADLREIARLLDTLGADSNCHQIDLSIARGLGYYDGAVFETVIEGAESFGSVYSGGRYNGLVSRFTGMPLPAIGASIGFDRLYAVLEHLKDLPTARPTPLKALIMDFGDEGSADQLLKLLSMLRSAGISSEVYCGSERSFKAQMNRALKMEIPLLIIPGERELQEGKVAVKNLNARTQVEVMIDDLVDHLNQIED